MFKYSLVIWISRVASCANEDIGSLGPDANDEMHCLIEIDNAYSNNAKTIKELVRLHNVLKMIAVQGSEDPLSIRKSDCMAALAKSTLEQSI